MTDILQALRDLRPPFKWKVKEARKNRVTCLAYVDARIVQDALDDTVGPANWKAEYIERGNRLFCRLSIRIDGEWVAKEDCGSDSNFEPEKGGVSDAFKRAAVAWGLCRFLYYMEPVVIRETVEYKDNRGQTKYAPADRGRRIWDINTFVQNQPAAQAPLPKRPQDKPQKPAPVPAVSDKRKTAELKKAVWATAKDIWPKSSSDDTALLNEIETACELAMDAKLSKLNTGQMQQFLIILQERDVG